MSKPVVRLDRTRDAALWDRLVAARAGATAYHEWAWLDFQSELLTVEIERLVVLADDEPVGVFPVARRGARSLTSPPLPFPFVGPLVPPDLLVAAVVAFRRRQRRTGLLLARFDLGAADTTADVVHALRGAGLDVVEDTTVAVDTGAYASLADLQADYAKMRRRAVRRAVRDGAAVRLARPGEFATLISQVLDEAYGAHGGGPSPYPAQLGARFEAWAADKPHVTTWVATVHDEPAGTLVMLGGHPTAVLWVGGCLQRFRSVNPNVLLYDASLATAIERGHRTLDFSGWVDDSVGRYKLQFAGERRAYLTLKSILGPAVVRHGLQRAKARLSR